MFDDALSHLPLFGLSLSILFALGLDKLIGEAERFHPLVGFGNLAKRIEAALNRGTQLKFKGMLAVVLCVFPLTLLGYIIGLWVSDDLLANIILSSFILYIAIGWRSLTEHATTIYDALNTHDLALAREAVSRIVSRDCAELNETEIAVAATESVLENGADAIFAAIFWFLIAGIPGVICYRLTNTLDAMWGYKNQRYKHFGWAAARLDDVLNYFPARLTALSYALTGHTRHALRCWFKQARLWKSPNAGPVMSAGAGAIETSLGGKAVYHGVSHLRPLLGLRLSKTTRASSLSIKKACTLINKALLLWLIFLISMTLLANNQSPFNLIEIGKNWLEQ